MPLSVGSHIGPYEILSLLGKGGMGEVYRARDPKLKRDVALKVLPEAFARDPERMARFQREAEVLASLNHPNIAAIYGVEDRALVMELVEGNSPRGPFPFDEAWHIASQIVTALEYAHDKGVMHRDLKPANVKVTPEGVVKLLDFGLAKAFTNQREAPASVGENSPTLTIGATEAGVILGTAAYMSPEQARGKQVDKRADIWSFGVVLYELLTGERLFTGEDAAETLAAVIHKQPDFARAPAKAQPLLRECLEKDPKQRLRDIGDAKRLLVSSRDGDGAEPPAAPSRSRFPAAGWIVAAVLLAIAVSTFVRVRATPPARESSARFELSPPGRLANGFFELSPDGRYLVFSITEESSSRLHVRPIDSLESQPLAGTEGARYPFWSPDSASIAFFAQGKLKRIALTGGAPQVLCDVPDAHGGAWSQDGVILFSPTSRSALQKVSATGGIPANVTTLSHAGDSHRYPVFLPDGRHFLYLWNAEKSEVSGIYAGSLDSSVSVRLLPDPSSAAYVPSLGTSAAGHLLFRRGTTLMAQPFDPDKLRLTGEMFPLAQTVGGSGNTFHAAFSASATGLLAYQSGTSSAARTLVWMSRSGERLKTVAAPGSVQEFSLSPDQTRLAAVMTSADSLNRDIWLGDLDRATMSRFTFGAGNAFMPVWSPDGRRIAFTTRDGATSRYQIYQKAASDAGQQELLLNATAANVFAYDWSPDGKSLVYAQDVEQTKRDLWLLPMEGPRKPVPYLQTSYAETHGQFSPDGKWMAYASDESGQSQIYVQSIPAGQAKRQVSTAGGVMPRWRRDGKELFYLSSDQKLMAVPVRTGASLDFAAPQALFDVPATTVYGNGYVYQPAADGQRFLVIFLIEGQTAPPLTVVVNWQAALKK